MRKFHRTRYGLVVTSAALAALGLTTGMSSYKSVDVVLNGRPYQGGTFASESVSAYLNRKGIHVATYDLVEPARKAPLQNGMKIVVRMAKAVLFKNGAASTVKVHTLAPTVADLLHSLHLQLRRGESLNVPQRARIREGMRVVLTRTETVASTEMVSLPYQVVRQDSSQYTVGTDVVSQPGETGLEQVVTKKLYVNGRMVAKRVARRILQTPVNEVVQVGSASAPASTNESTSTGGSASPPSLAGDQTIQVVATAYSSPGGYTATGAPAQYGDVAVDPSVIPLGTRLYIPGYGYGVANDTGGAIQGYRIDLCFNSVQQALDWGRQDVTVYILGQN